MIQLVIRVDDQLAASVDELVDAGRFQSRSDAVRELLRDGVDRERRAQIGREILDGYQRVPETKEELDLALAATRAMIAEEPW